MSEEQERQARADLLLRYHEAKERHAILSEEARNIAIGLEHMANSLRKAPGEIVFGKREMDSMSEKKREHNPTFLDFERISRLVADIRATREERDRLKASAKESGLPVE